ncbi:hypothetical protein KUTeg_001498 [Tegillarca granosa]|uniref:Glucose-methanol-choline oxidoreductase N-terminal domain-containing protein n=1 Tax=Tegillarca granosa TaxID=220873 RepID=A0ABQ9FRM0_TEGGR|nr:hypothetical protein KUTeg_001498 [Tegillarca granosa]
MEAGGSHLDRPESALIDTPSQALQLWYSNVSWPYFTVPQKNAFFGLNYNSGFTTRGKVLGGSSSINYMIYSRGKKTDYDKWAADGATGWDYDSIFPYFLKSEDIRIPELMNSSYHSTCGPLVVSGLEDSPLTDLYIRAANDIGIPTVDCSAPLSIGI